MISVETEHPEHKRLSAPLKTKDAATRKRILFLASQTENRANGGMESATRIFEALSDDFSWTLITTHDSSFSQRWKEAGAKVVITPFGTSSSKTIRIVQWMRWSLQVAWTLLRTQPDCVHANDIRACRIAALPARIQRVPLLFTLRGTKPAHESYGKHWYRATKQCQGVITLSEELSDEAAKRLGISNDKISVINSIVDVDKFAPIGERDKRAKRNVLGINDRVFAIGVVGVIRDIKGQLALIEQTLPALCERLPDARVYLIGDFEPESDTYSAKCRDAAERLSLSDRVVFCGHTAEIAAWYRALDVVLVPSLYEGLARCMIEAMACGVPVVSFDVCSAREMLEETGAGIVIPQGDYAGLTDAMVRLAGDRSARRVMADAGRKVAERSFSEQRIAEDYRQLYEDVAGHAGGKTSGIDHVKGEMR